MMSMYSLKLQQAANEQDKGLFLPKYQSTAMKATRYNGLKLTKCLHVQEKKKKEIILHPTRK